MSRDQSNKRSLDYSIGISRNKTSVFEEYKENALSRKNGKNGRFSKR